MIKMQCTVNINKFGETLFSSMNPYACIAVEIELDFSAKFDEKTKVWTASWKWSDDQSPNKLTNRMPSDMVSAQIWWENQHKQQTLLNSGWLLLYSEKKFDEPKGLILLMAENQQNKSKVCSVLDFCGLNGYFYVYTPNIQVCKQKLLGVPVDWLITNSLVERQTGC